MLSNEAAALREEDARAEARAVLNARVKRARAEREEEARAEARAEREEETAAYTHLTLPTNRIV